MPALVIAIGNKLRRDDGVAHRVIKLLHSNVHFTTRSVLQLAPEVAMELAPYDPVIFVDADVQARQVKIEPLRCVTIGSSWTHVSRPEETAALARILFGFSGQAFTCRVPALDLSTGDALSVHAKRFVPRAALQIEELIEAQSKTNAAGPESLAAPPAPASSPSAQAP